MVGFVVIVDVAVAEGLLKSWMTTGVCVEPAGEVVEDESDVTSGSVASVGCGEDAVPAAAEGAAEAAAEEEVTTEEVSSDGWCE